MSVKPNPTLWDGKLFCLCEGESIFVHAPTYEVLDGFYSNFAHWVFSDSRSEFIFELNLRFETLNSQYYDAYLLSIKRFHLA